MPPTNVRILVALADHGPMHYLTISACVKASIEATHSAIRRLGRMGLVRRVGRGRYARAKWNRGSKVEDEE